VKIAYNFSTKTREKEQEKTKEKYLPGRNL
jgi:hypothetical protein